MSVAMTLVALRQAAELLPPGSSLTIPREALLAMVDGTEHGSSAPPDTSTPPTSERLLDVTEAAALLGMAPRWLYRHASSLPFTRRIGRKALRFSERGLRRWLERQSGALASSALW